MGGDLPSKFAGHSMLCPYGTKINRRAIVMARAISERCLRRGGGGRRGLRLPDASRRSAARRRGRRGWWTARRDYQGITRRLPPSV